MDAAAERFVGTAESIERRGHELTTVAADGLIVVKRACADHQRRGRACLPVPAEGVLGVKGVGGTPRRGGGACGPAAENGAAGADAGPDRAGTVAAADGLVTAERAADDGEAGGVLNGATGA